MPALLDRLGLARPELRAWAMYDWAISAFQCVITTAVFPIYFVKVAGAGLGGSAATQRYSAITTLALVIVAVLAPLLGAVADYSARKKAFCAAFLVLGAGSVAAMYCIHQGDLALASWLYVLANIGAAASFTFYEALLPHIAAPDEVDRVSTAGYAVGYIGGGLLLVLALVLILKPALFGLAAGTDEASKTLPTRLAFVATAAWWALFAIPLFRRVPEPRRVLETDERPGVSAVAAAFTRLGETVRELGRFRDAALLLVAFALYNDGIQTIIRLATAFGTEIGIAQGALIGAVVLVQFIGLPASFLFGGLAARIGPKRAVFAGLVVYTLISVVGYFMRTAAHFFVLAGLVGLVQGGTQALSRSLFASMVPPHKSGEFFGFFSVFEKFAGIVGPLFFTVSIAITGSSRGAILSVILFFAAGAFVLARVDVAAGRRAAAQAERDALG